MTEKLFILVILLLASAPAFAQSVYGESVQGESVDTAWVRRYNGPLGAGSDEAQAIAIDHLGDVYVTGYSVGNGTDRDYATIKYYPNGDTAWVRRYNGPPGNTYDFAYDIAIDASMNVYVTGASCGGTWSDCATIKYYPNGDTVWVKRYNGPEDYMDEAFAIAVDGSGNVYVTGVTTPKMLSGWSLYDYVTIKYYASGDTAWVRTYNGPQDAIDVARDIAVDESGNVYVTGYIAGLGYDYATIKYYPNGDTAWVRIYDGPGHSDSACAIAVDRSGNVYVTGSSSGIGTSDDYATIKYYSNGDTAWVRRYNDTSNLMDYAHAIAVDDSGNVYVTGASHRSGNGYEYATIKYYPNGDTVWVRRYEDGYSAEAIAIDDSGNIYVTGSGVHNYATIKYFTNGDTAWVGPWNGLPDNTAVANGIAVDDNGSVYVTGEHWGAGTSFDYATIKYVQFLCGDVNKDGVLNSADVVYLINYLFIGGPAPVPILQVGDVNQDGVINSADVVYLINYLFIGGPAPCS